LHPTLKIIFSQLFIPVYQQHINIIYIIFAALIVKYYNMYFFNDKVVVVTGGSDGIGRALVHALLQQGAKVSTCARNYDKLYQLKTNYPDKPFIIHTADVSKEVDCENFINETVKTFGTIDILINNAGISMRALFEETGLDTLRRVMDINFWGTVYCTRYALPYIKQQKGTVVGISSVAGYRGLPGRTGYNASKFAVHGFLEALRTELLYTGVNVMWVCPGFTTSNIRNAALTKDGVPQGFTTLDEGHLMTAEECAQLTIKAIAKHNRTLVYTWGDKRTILMNKLFPKLADKLVHNFFYKKGELVK
jgi:short-subunit dehydrogenase